MKATKEQIIAEANRRRAEHGEGAPPVEHFIVDVVCENWTPPDPVDPDLLAWREWFAQRAGSAHKSGILAGHWDSTSDADAYLAGARMAREQERERAKVLVECVERYAGPHAAMAIAKYRGEA